MWVAPTGTVAVSEVAVAAVTVALVAPKYTMLLAGVVLKLVPVIVTDVPGLAGLGETEVIIGADKSGSFRNIEMDDAPLFATIISGLVSPSMSPIPAANGLLPTA